MQKFIPAILIQPIASAPHFRWATEHGHSLKSRMDATTGVLIAQFPLHEDEAGIRKFHQ